MQPKRILVAVIAAAMLNQGAHAGTIAGTGGSTEITQILNNAELLQQSGEMYAQTKQLINQVKMAEQQLKNLVASPEMIWGEAPGQLQQLAQLVAKGQALGYALNNIDQQFASKYPAANGNALRGSYIGTARTWNQTSRDSLKNALSVAGLQANQFADEQTAMNSIQNLASSAPGSLQATQAGVMVAAQQVQQLQKLRQLFMTQMQAQNAVLAAQVDKDAEAENLAQSHFQKYTPSTGGKFSSSGGKK
jgi:P-type conjugative transfer protein TrbJ